MSDFLIRPNEVKNTAQQLKIIKDTDMETLRKIRILIIGLKDNWEGMAADALINNYMSRQSNLNDFYNTLDSFIELLNTACDKSVAVDNELLNAIYRI